MSKVSVAYSRRKQVKEQLGEDFLLKTAFFQAQSVAEEYSGVIGILITRFKRSKKQDAIEDVLGKIKEIVEMIKSEYGGKVFIKISDRPSEKEKVLKETFDCVQGSKMFGNIMIIFEQDGIAATCGYAFDLLNFEVNVQTCPTLEKSGVGLAIYDFYELNNSKAKFFCQLWELQMIKACWYYGKLAESVLKLANSEESYWLFEGLIRSINSQPKKQIEVKNLATLFNLSKPDFKTLITSDNQKLLFAYEIFNQENRVAKREAISIDKTNMYLAIIDEIDKKFKTNHTEAHSWWWTQSVKIKGKNGRILLRDYKQALPGFVSFYQEKNLKKNYSIRKYLSYLEGELKKNPELSWRDCKNALEDFNRMKEQIAPDGKFILPYNCVKSHDNMIKLYNEFSNKIYNNGQMTDLSAAYGMFPKELYEDDTYCMIAPNYGSDLAREGASLNHCVGGYIGNVCNGRSKIWFLRKKSKIDTPLVTVELVRNNSSKQNFVVSQQRGFGNRFTTEAESDFIDKWLNDTNKKIREGAEVRIPLKNKNLAAEIKAMQDFCLAQI